MAQPAYSRLGDSPIFTELPSFVNVCYRVLRFPHPQGEYDEEALVKADKKAQEILGANAENLAEVERRWEKRAFQQFKVERAEDGRVLSTWLFANKPLDPKKVQGIPKYFLTFNWKAKEKLIDLMLLSKERKFLYELLCEHNTQAVYNYILLRAFSYNAKEILQELLTLPHFDELNPEEIHQISAHAGVLSAQSPDCSTLWREKLQKIS